MAHAGHGGYFPDRTPAPFLAARGTVDYGVRKPETGTWMARLTLGFAEADVA